MRNPTAYLKMRVLGAIDMAEGKTIRDRIKAVSQTTFTDEEGQPRQFTWRTISTWLCRYQKHGVTVMENKPRSDKGKIRKVPLEDVPRRCKRFCRNCTSVRPGFRWSIGCVLKMGC